jgi:hypothetical protein
MKNHVSARIVENRKILVYKFVIEFDLIFSQFMVVSVYFVYQLSIEVNQFLKLLLQQTSHTFLLTFLSLLFSYFRS